MRNWILTQTFYSTPRKVRGKAVEAPRLITHVLPDLYTEERAKARATMLNSGQTRMRYDARPATEEEFAEITAMEESRERSRVEQGFFRVS